MADISLNSLENSLNTLKKLQHVSRKSSLSATDRHVETILRGSKAQKLIVSMRKQGQQLLAEVAAVKIQSIWRRYYVQLYIDQYLAHLKEKRRQLSLFLSEAPHIAEMFLEEVCLHACTSICLDLGRRIAVTLNNRLYSHNQQLDEVVSIIVDEVCLPTIRGEVRNCIQLVLSECLTKSQNERIEEMRRQDMLRALEEAEAAAKENARIQQIEAEIEEAKAEAARQYKSSEELAFDEIVLEYCRNHLLSISRQAIQELAEEFLEDNRIRDVANIIIGDLIHSSVIEMFPEIKEQEELNECCEVIINEAILLILQQEVSNEIQCLASEIADNQRRAELHLISETMKRTVVQKLFITHMIRNIQDDFDSVLIQKHLRDLVTLWTSRRLVSVVDSIEKEWHALSESPLLQRLCDHVIRPPLQENLLNLWIRDCSDQIINHIDELESTHY